jgi:hypothetical protein
MIRNANTRAAYYRAIQHFLAWAERAGDQHLENTSESDSRVYEIDRAISKAFH